jgi:hypothetical protein
MQLWFVKEVDHFRRKGVQRRTAFEILPPSEVESLSQEIFNVRELLL